MGSETLRKEDAKICAQLLDNTPTHVLLFVFAFAKPQRDVTQLKLLLHYTRYESSTKDGRT